MIIKNKNSKKKNDDVDCAEGKEDEAQEDNESDEAEEE